MSFRKAGPLAAAMVMMAAASGASAHHSVYGAFDMTSPRTMTGVVREVHWINPHVFFAFDTKDAAGKTVTWRLESQPVAAMRNAGLTKASLIGDGKPVEISFLPPRKADAGNIGFLLKIKLPNGKFIQFAPEK